MTLRAVLAACLVFVSFSAAFAQDTPAFEGSFGYSFLRQEGNLNRHGWVASAAGNINDWFGVKGEVGGSYTDLLNTDPHSFLAGPQFTMRADPGIVPWAHFLLGVTRTERSELRVFSSSPAGSTTVFIVERTNSDFALQPGGGVDFWITSHFGIRVGADYRRTFRTGQDLDFGRLQAGIVFGIGER